MVSPSMICVTRAVKDCVGEGETAGGGAAGLRGGGVTWVGGGCAADRGRPAYQ
jgi:hypothetical protein